MELFRTRNVIVLFKGDVFTVSVGAPMISGGWAGGQGVQWLDSSNDEFLVTYSDGVYGGFLLWGSDEPSDQYISFTQQQLAYGYGVMCVGGWLISTRTFERYTYASRLVPPLVPITYTVGERVRFSLSGKWTNEDEWTLSGDPRGANNFFVGSVVQIPTGVGPDDHITLQTSI